MKLLLANLRLSRRRNTTDEHCDKVRASVACGVPGQAAVLIGGGREIRVVRPPLWLVFLTQPQHRRWVFTLHMSQRELSIPRYSRFHFDRPFPIVRCLPFDGIGARHPGIAALVGRTMASAGQQPGFPTRFWSIGSSATRGSCQEYIVDFCEQHDSGN